MKGDQMDDELESIRRKKMEEMMKSKEGTGSKNWPDGPVTVTDGTFDSFIHEYPMVVVDCWAPWCAPCRIVGPVIEELAKEYTSKVAFAKLNIDENQHAALNYSIMSIPTMLIFKNGQLIDRPVGAMPKEMLSARIKKYLG